MEKLREKNTWEIHHDINSTLDKIFGKDEGAGMSCPEQLTLRKKKKGRRRRDEEWRLREEESRGGGGNEK